MLDYDAGTARWVPVKICATLFTWLDSIFQNYEATLMIGFNEAHYHPKVMTIPWPHRYLRMNTWSPIIGYSRHPKPTTTLSKVPRIHFLDHSVPRCTKPMSYTHRLLDQDLPESKFTQQGHPCYVTGRSFCWMSGLSLANAWCDKPL